MNLINKRCLFCNKLLSARAYKNKAYCNTKCSGKAREERTNAAKPKLYCISCGEQLKNNERKFCSRSCNSKTNKAIFNSFSPNRSSSTVGAISELMVCADLLCQDFDVFRSVSPTCPCDIIAMKNGMLLRIEVKTTQADQEGNPYEKFTLDRTKFDVLALVLPTKPQIIYQPDISLMIKNDK